MHAHRKRDALEQARAAGDELAAADVRALPVDLDITEPDAAAAAAKPSPRTPDDSTSSSTTLPSTWTGASWPASADLAQAERVVTTNLFGAWRLIQALLPTLRQSSDPRIVNASSGAGSHGDQQFGLARRGAAAAT